MLYDSKKHGILDTVKYQCLTQVREGKERIGGPQYTARLGKLLCTLLLQ